MQISDPCALSRFAKPAAVQGKCDPNYWQIAYLGFANTDSKLKCPETMWKLREGKRVLCRGACVGGEQAKSKDGAVVLL